MATGRSFIGNGLAHAGSDRTWNVLLLMEDGAWILRFHLGAVGICNEFEVIASPWKGNDDVIGSR